MLWAYAARLLRPSVARLVLPKAQHGSLVASARAPLTPVLLPRTQHEGDSGRSQANVDKTTDEQLKTLDTAFDKNRKAVVEKLLERLTEVEPQLHRNLKKVEA